MSCARNSFEYEYTSRANIRMWTWPEVDQFVGRTSAQCHFCSARVLNTNTNTTPYRTPNDPQRSHHAHQMCAAAQQNVVAAILSVCVCVCMRVIVCAVCGDTIVRTSHTNTHAFGLIHNFGWTRSRRRWRASPSEISPTAQSSALPPLRERIVACRRVVSLR